MITTDQPHPVAGLFARRVAPTQALAADAPVVARCCQAMAARFRRGGKLIVFGNGATTSDAQHVAVEFVHPVVVGTRALPAIALTADVATMTGVANRAGFHEVVAHQIGLIAEPADIALGLSPDGRCANVAHGLRAAHRLGLLTVALTGGGGGDIGADPAVDFPLVAASDDPRVVKEVHVTTYHILWELVHVYLARPDTPAEAVR